jgi:hypothetical protein
MSVMVQLRCDPPSSIYVDDHLKTIFTFSVVGGESGGDRIVVQPAEAA